MVKKTNGTCCICGQETKLTFEHIPPRAAFNRFNVKLYNFWNYILNNNTRYTQFQKGAGGHTLCSSCNSLTGKWYGAAYAEFADQGMKYFKNNSQGLISVAYTIYPLRVFKQIVSCFASVNGPLWCQQNPSIKDFLLNPHEQKFPAEIDIRMYMQIKGRSKLGGISGQMNPFTGERFVGSEWAYSPFSYICVCDKNYLDYRVLNELYPVKRFSQHRYDDRLTLYLNIPRKFCNPAISDFREGIPDMKAFIESNKKK